MRSTFRARAYQIQCIPTSTDPPSDTLDLIDDDEMSPPPYNARRPSLPRSSYLQTPTRYVRGRSVSSHSTTSTESGPQPSPNWFAVSNFTTFAGDYDRSKSLVNINKRSVEQTEEDDDSPRSGRSTTRSTLRYTNNEEFSDLLGSEGTTGRRPGAPSGASIGGTTRRIGPVNRQMSDVSSISPRRMMKGRSPSAPSLGGRKLKRMDSTATTISQTSNNTSTSSIRGSVNSHGLASQSSESPSSSSMGVRPESVVSRQSRIVTVKSKTSVSSIGAERRSVSSLPPVSRPDSELSIAKPEESTELPHFVHSLVWKLTEFVFIGNESVSTNAHVLCRLNIGATIELYDGPELEDNRRTFDNTCFCEKRSHARSQFKLKVPDNEHDAHLMALNKANGETYSLSDMLRVFCGIVEKEVAAQRRVLVFSRRGRNRAPAFCVGYLMKLQNISRRNAQQLVEQQMDTMRPKIQIEQYLIRALLQWQLKLNLAMDEPAALYKTTRDLFTAKAINESVTVRRGSMEKVPPKQAW
ncbi:hypothetical protein PRIPAC_90656 [Pristionchus pacificus]|uniref:Uncharacterized protein n=1 Tax=Pristionchus pacificus TaxID=54126 RepID=A0A2A6CZ51_PRIPA|nr:hypothetical protein PRIPAC_90656 [Pristionchus pacificus]|eukprot:PDM83303.1 hypothetical protein PRIPAC_34935 [Pristionchus pacificus]